MAKYCADCAWMGTSENKGQFPCNNPASGYKLVSARMYVCGKETICLNSRRSETERENLMTVSRRAGYFIVTAVTEILGLERDNKYLQYFMYVKDVVLPRLHGGMEWIQDYEEYGPQIQDCLFNSESKEDIAQELLDGPLTTFKGLMDEGNVDEAITAYQNMYEQLKVKFGLKPEPMKLRLFVPPKVAKA